MAEDFMAVVEQEAGRMLTSARERGELDWDTFIVSWYAVVRRVVLGEGARHDHEMTSMLAKLMVPSP